MDYKDCTVVICCAGMGTRLGIGSTKALIDVCGKPLIIHQLEQLEKFEDIRIAVGYQAKSVIDIVNKYRTDIMYVFNYEYSINGPAASLSKALIGARKYILSIDGDVLFNAEDFKRFLESDLECVAISKNHSYEAVKVKTEGEFITEFNNYEGEFEWPGIAKVRSDKLSYGSRNIYEMLTPLLPLSTKYIDCKEINTAEDYESAIKWVENGGIENER